MTVVGLVFLIKYVNKKPPFMHVTISNICFCQGECTENQSPDHVSGKRQCFIYNQGRGQTVQESWSGEQVCRGVSKDWSVGQAWVDAGRHEAEVPRRRAGDIVEVRRVFTDRSGQSKH